MRTGGKRKILVKSGGSKTQPLDTNPRHECSQRGPIGTRNTAPHRPDGLRSPPSGGACYRELPRILLMSTSSTALPLVGLLRTSEKPKKAKLVLSCYGELLFSSSSSRLSLPLSQSSNVGSHRRFRQEQ